MNNDSQEVHKFHIKVTLRSLNDFCFPLGTAFFVAEFPTWTDPHQEATHKMNFRFPEVDIPPETEQVLYPYHSEPAIYLLTQVQFRELLTLRPFIGEV